MFVNTSPVQVLSTLVDLREGALLSLCVEITITESLDNMEPRSWMYLIQRMKVIARRSSSLKVWFEDEDSVQALLVPVELETDLNFEIDVVKGRWLIDP